MSMKKILSILLAALPGIAAFAQITPNGNSGATTTFYTNGTPNDPIYIWCAQGIGNNTASLTATPASGSGPWTFKWFYHQQSTSSWEPYFTETGSTSTVSNLPSDGYRVQIYANGGAAAGCFTAWVWNMNTNISASQTPVTCNFTNLAGNITTEGSFTYYNPPPPESLITAATQVSVCFSATHTYVSDLAFYLVGPPSAGSPVVLLSPNPGANGQGSTCNSNNNVSNLCFSSASTNHFNPCNEQCCGFLCLNTTSCTSNYTGTYGNYGPGNTVINWSPIYGANAAEGGWAVQIYDCIGSDVGALTNASITFSNLNTNCGGSSSITYSSGSINSAINDNSCSAATASIFQVPVSTTLTTPITINASTSYLWTANTAASIPNASSSLTPSVTSVPSGNNTFTLTATVTYANASCTYSDQVSFNSNCCSITANAGPDVSFCTGGSAQIGAAVTGATYSWSPATGLSNANIAQPTVTLTNSGTSPVNHTYTLTVTDPLDASCTTTDNVIVTVNPLPVTDAGTYSAACSDAADLTLTGSPAGGTFSGTGVTSGMFDPSAGTQTITYTYTDANGCTNTAMITITVNNLPNVDAGPDQSICAGNSTTLSGSGASSYTWNNGVTNGTPFTPASTATYTVTGTDANGCVNTDQVIVNVNPIPTVQLSNTTICAGTSATLTPVLSSPQGTLLWNTGATTATLTVSPSQTTTYSVVHTVNGCSSPAASATVTVNPAPALYGGPDQVICAGDQVILTAMGGNNLSWTNGVINGTPFFPTSTMTYTVTGTENGCTSTDQVTVTVNPLPNIQGGADITVCLGQQVTLSGTGGVSYSWNNGAQNGQPFAPPLGTQTYTLSGIDGNGCAGTDQVTVSVLPVPVSGFTADTYEGYPPLTVNFTQNASNGTSYTWNLGNGITTTSSAPVNITALYENTGIYTVILTVTNGVCSSDHSAQIKVNPFPDAEIFVPNVFTPNGDKANDYFAIEVKYGASISVQIFNRWGNLMKELNSFTDKWDGENATDGVYFFKYLVKDLNGKEFTGHGHVTLER